jgi:hypothetical protein
MFLGTVVFVNGIMNEWRYLNLLTYSSQAEGKVIEIDTYPLAKRQVLVPIFQFEANGQTFKVRSQQAINTFSGLNVKQGDQITVLYDSKNPAEAEIKKDGLNPFIAKIILGALIMYLGFSLFKVAHQNDESSLLYRIFYRRR